MRTTHTLNRWADAPSREAMRTPHKSRHTVARFTTRNPRGVQS